MNFWAKWATWAKWGEADDAAVTYSISGTINDSAGAGLDGVTVTLTGDASDSVVTAGGGAYQFTGLAAGSYTVTPTKAGSTFLPASAAVTIVAANKTATTMAQVWDITGQILDSAGAGLSGVTVTLSGDASDTDTTDGSGNYSFPNLPDGSYTATPTLGGSTFSPTSADASISGADKAVSSMAQVWAITGNITDDYGAALSGVLVTLTGDASDTDTTDASGDFTLPGLADGSYTVTPTKTDYNFVPVSDAVAISGASDTSDFAGSLFPLAFDFEDGTIGQDVSVGTPFVKHMWRVNQMVVQARPSTVYEFEGYAKSAKLETTDVQGEGCVVDVGYLLPPDFKVEIGWVSSTVEGYFATIHNQNVANGSEGGVRTGV
ncbi:MAG: carboxypeptidase regulatory-like domain-containing protein, partial [Planctomycetota bacterium]